MVWKGSGCARSNYLGGDKGRLPVVCKDRRQTLVWAIRDLIWSCEALPSLEHWRFAGLGVRLTPPDDDYRSQNWLERSLHSLEMD